MVAAADLGHPTPSLTAERLRPNETGKGQNWAEDGVQR